MTELTDLDAARSDFMECAVGAAAGKGGKDNDLEERQARCEFSYPIMLKGHPHVSAPITYIALIYADPAADF